MVFFFMVENLIAIKTGIESMYENMEDIKEYKILQREKMTENVKDIKTSLFFIFRT